MDDDGNNDSLFQKNILRIKTIDPDWNKVIALRQLHFKRTPELELNKHLIEVSLH